MRALFQLSPQDGRRSILNSWNPLAVYQDLWVTVKMYPQQRNFLDDRIQVWKMCDGSHINLFLLSADSRACVSNTK